MFNFTFLDDSASSVTSHDENESESSYEEVSINRKEMKKKRNKKRKHRHSSSGDNSDSSETENRRVSAKKKKKKHHKSFSSKKEKKKKQKKHNKHHEKSAEIKKIIKPDTIWLEDTMLEIEDAFRKDRRPDRKNLEYGCLYKMDVAKFYSNKKMNYLGTDSTLTRQQLKKKKKNSHNSSSTYRYFSAPSSKSRNTNDVIVDDDVNDDDIEFIHTLESDVFLPLMTKRRTDDNDSKQMMDVNNKISERQKEFSRQLLKRPNDVSLWIEFIDRQDDWVPWSNEIKDDQNWVTSRALLDKKVSIVEKALVSNPASSELILKHMNLVKRVWSPDRITERWRKLVFQFPNRSLFWAEYLCHVQTDILSKKTVSQTVELYRKAFKMLIGIHKGDVTSHKRELNSMDGIIMLLNQMILYLWQAGRYLLSFVLYESHRKVIINRYKSSSIRLLFRCLLIGSRTLVDNSSLELKRLFCAEK